MKKRILATVLMLVCVLAHAEPSNWRFFGRFGTGFGGEKFASGNYSNSSAYWEVGPGTGMKYALGADYRLAEKVTLQGSVGREVSTIPNAANGDLTFTRIPVELLGFYDLSRDFRLGGGLRYSTNPNMTGSGFAEGWSGLGGYEPSLGAVLEGQYLFVTPEKGSAGNGQFGLSLRYVSESFKKNGTTTSGDHYELGLVLYY